MSNEPEKLSPQEKVTIAAEVPPHGFDWPGIRTMVSGFAAALGVGAARQQVGPAPDTGTALALERTYWAAQRTLMGWIRTALSMISFGFTIGKLGQTLTAIEVHGLRGQRMVGVDSMAYFLVILGTLGLLAAAVQFSRRVHILCEGGLQRKPSIEFVVALVLSLMGMLAFSTLVLKV
jgi:putative membrane protein